MSETQTCRMNTVVPTLPLEDYLRRLPGRCPSCGYHLKTQKCQCNVAPIAPTDEWAIFCAALRQAAAASADGRVHQHLVRPLIRGRVFHKSVGRFYRRAKAEGLLEPVGEEQSKDTAGRNTHHKSPVYELRAA